MRDDDEGNKIDSEQFGTSTVTRLDQVDSVRPTNLYRTERPSMEQMIPMTELSYEGTKDDEVSTKKRQDSCNISTTALVESLDQPNNPNHRVSSSSSSPTTIGSPSSPQPPIAFGI